MSLFSSKSSPSSFWKWFQDHEQEFFALDPKNAEQQEKLFDLLARHLHRIHRDLTFEFGPSAPIRELVLSADGIKSVFPAVVSLWKAAPSLERWKITAFRPRRDTGYSIQLGNRSVDPSQVEFTLLDNGEKAGLRLFIPGMETNDIAYKQIGYLLLDNALGEFDVETNLGTIEMLPPSAQTEGERHMFSKLPALFDQLAARLGKRSLKPS